MALNSKAGGGQGMDLFRMAPEVWGYDGVIGGLILGPEDIKER